MPDPTVLVLRHLLGDAALVTLLGGPNVFGGELPLKFDPTIQPAVVVCGEGGNAHPEVPVVSDRVKVRVWAGIEQYVLARQVYAEVFKRLHQQNMIDLAPDGFILISQESVRGQDLTDPDFGWATVLSWYEITSRES